MTLKQIIKSDKKKEVFVAYLAQELNKINKSHEQEIDMLELYLKDLNFDVIRSEGVFRIPSLPGFVFGIDKINVIADKCFKEEEPVQHL